ncbi:MAG: PQQ-binding-like beta-propeller repeat protein [Candidatus Bathyarchaeia archaeon]
MPSDLLQYDWLGPQCGLSTHYSAGPAPNSPSILWKMNLPPFNYASGGIALMGSSNPVAFNGKLFLNIGNNIAAMDPFTGAIIYNVTVPSVLSGRVCLAANVMKIDETYMVTMSRTVPIINATHNLPGAWSFVCLRIADGSQVWTSSPVYTSTELGGPLYYSETKMIYIDNSEVSGNGGTQNPGILQAWKLSDPAQPPTLAWTYVGLGPVYISVPAVAVVGDGKLFPQCEEPHQVCLDAETGQVLWDAQLTGTPTYIGSYSDGVLYRGLLDNTFVAMDGDTGKIIWSFNPHTYGYWCSGTAVAYGMVYALNVDGYEYALDITDGHVVWQHLGSAFYPGLVEVADGKVYARTGEGMPQTGTTNPGYSRYSCLNAYTGEVIWEVSKEMASGPLGRVCIAYGNLYGVDPGYSIYAGKTLKPILYCFGGEAGKKDWSMFGSNEAHSAVGSGGPIDMKLSWRFQTGGAVVSSPSIVAGKVYVGSDDKNLYCIDASSGNKIWSFATGTSIRSSPAVVNGKVYTGTDDGFLYCLDANSGSQIWKASTPGQQIPIVSSTYPRYTSSPTVVSGKVYAGGSDGKLYCLNADSGNVYWTIQTTDAILSTPTYNAGDGVYFASIDGFVYKVNPDNGNIIWNISTPIGLETAMEGTPIIGNGLVVIGSGAAKGSPAKFGRIYAFDMSTGNLVWNYTERSTSGNMQVTWTALFVNHPNLGPVFYFNDFYFLDCVNATSGKLLWDSYLTREGFGIPTYSDGKLYVGRNAYGVYCVDAESGKKLGYFDAGSWVESTVALYDNKIYFGSLDWGVYCVSQSSAGTTYYGNSQTPQPSTPAPITSAPIATPSASATVPPKTEGTFSDVYSITIAAVVIIVIVAALSVVLVRRRGQKT